MSKYFVVQGSVLVDKNKPAGVGQSVELSPEVAAGLVASGYLLEEKQFNSRRKMLEGALESGGILSKGDAKLAAALGVKAAPKQEKPKGGA